MGVDSIIYGTIIIKPICKIDNLTYAYKATTDKSKVTCKKCLKKLANRGDK